MSSEPKAVAWQRRVSLNGIVWTDWETHKGDERPRTVWVEADDPVMDDPLPAVADYRPLYDEQALSALRAEVEALRRAIETIDPRFRSGNSIKVDGAHVPREEWDALIAAMEQSA